MTTDTDNQDNKRSTEQETLETSERKSCIICECELPDGDNIDNLNDDELLCGECVARNRNKSASHENDDNNGPPPSPAPTDRPKGYFVSHITSSSPRRKPSSYRYYYEPGGSWPR